MLIVWWAWNFKTTSSSCSGSRNSLTRNPRAGGWELEKSTPLPKLRRRGRRLTTNKKVNDTLVRDWNSWWSLVRDKNHVMGDECSFDGWLLMDGFSCFDFDFPNSHWKRDEYDAVKARHGAPLGQGSPRSTLWCASRWPYYHWRWRFCTHTVKSVSISEMLESAATDHRTPLQSRILLSNQSGKQVKHQQLLSTNVLIAHFPSSTSSQYQNSYLDLAV